MTIHIGRRDFIVALGGAPARAMQTMAIRGLIDRDRGTGAYVLTDTGHAAFAAMLEGTGIKVAVR